MENIKNLFLKYKNFTETNKYLTPIISFIPIGEKQNSFQYVGGQIFDNVLYGIVNSATKMLKYDINNQKIDFLGLFDERDFKWTGGCIYNNSLYALSRLKSSLLEFDLNTQEFKEMPCAFKYDAEHHYGGVCTREGIIYQPPRSTNHILKWDLKSKACEKIIINNGKNCRYCGSIIHPNGYIYFIPEKDYKIAKINIESEEITYIGKEISPMVFDPVIAPNGNIYGFSSHSGILKIDTENDFVSMLYGDVKIGTYGSKMGVNGKIYSLPGYTNNIWEFDPESEKIQTIFQIDSSKAVRYAGGAVNKNGDIYALPVHEDRLLKISFNKDISINTELYNLFFKDFY